MKGAHEVALGLGLLLALAGSARPGRAEPSAQALEAQRDFESGLVAFEQGDLWRARALFESSAQRLVRPSTLVNLALVDLRLGLPEEALRAVDELDALLATAADASARERFAGRALALRQGVEEQLRLRAASPPPSVVAASTLPSLPPPADAPPRRSPPSRRVPRFMAGTAGVLGLSALGTGAIWWREVEQNMAACHGEDGATCLELREISRQRQFAMHTTITLGSVALALGIGSAAWLFRVRRPPEKGATSLGAQSSALVRPLVAPRALGLELRGCF